MSLLDPMKTMNGQVNPVLHCNPRMVYSVALNCATNEKNKESKNDSPLLFTRQRTAIPRQCHHPCQSGQSPSAYKLKGWGPEGSSLQITLPTSIHQQLANLYAGVLWAKGLNKGENDIFFPNPIFPSCTAIVLRL